MKHMIHLLLVISMIAAFGCAGGAAEYYKAQADYRTMMTETIKATSGDSVDVCKTKFTQGGTIPAGMEQTCSIPKVLLMGQQLQHIAPPQQYKDETAGVVRDVLLGLGGIAAGTITKVNSDNKLFRFAGQAVMNAGGNTTISDSYNPSTPTITTTTQSGTFDSYNGDNRDNRPVSTVTTDSHNTDSHNTDRHDTITPAPVVVTPTIVPPVFAPIPVATP
jgi:hypothetical protein